MVLAIELVPPWNHFFRRVLVAKLKEGYAGLNFHFLNWFLGSNEEALEQYQNLYWPG